MSNTQRREATPGCPKNLLTAKEIHQIDGEVASFKSSVCQRDCDSDKENNSDGGGSVSGTGYHEMCEIVKGFVIKTLKIYQLGLGYLVW